MNNTKFVSRYLPFEEFCLECEKLGENHLGRQKKEYCFLPVEYFHKKLGGYYAAVKKKYAERGRAENYERVFAENYTVIASALDSLGAEKNIAFKLNAVNGIPALFILMSFAAENNRGKLDENIIKSAVENYQRFSPFGIKELCLLKEACRYALIKYAVNLISLASDISETIAKAEADAFSGRFSLSDIDKSEYVGCLLKCADADMKTQTETLLSDNGKDPENFVSLFEYKKSDLCGGIITLADSMRKLDDLITDEFILGLSAADKYLREIAEKNYAASDNATKLYLLGLIADNAKKMNETAYISYASTKYGKDFFVKLTEKSNDGLRKIYNILAITVFVVQVVLFSVLKPVLLLLLLPLMLAEIQLFRTVVSCKVKRLRAPTSDITENDKKETLIVLCCLIGSRSEAEKNINRLLTVKYANRGFDCCLLCDFMPSADGYFTTEERNTADFIAGKARQENFAAIIRKRIKNTESGMYEGYEKKRGALLDLNGYLLGEKKDFYKAVNLNESYKNVITLDEDSFCFRAEELCAVMKHPMNDRYVIAGLCGKPYLSAVHKNAYTRLFCGNGGVDAYSEATVSFERDVLLCGNYTGKGIYRIKEFTEKIKNVFPDNTILSHDFIEGAFCGTIATGYDVYEDCPDNFEKSEARRLRWLRGDVQLAPYLFGNIKLKNGEKQKNPLSLSQKSHILFNILCGVSPLIIFISEIVFALTGDWPLLWFSLFCVFYPVLAHFTAFPVCFCGLGKTLLQTLFFQAELPYRAVTDTYAVILSLLRVLRRKNLLRWQTFAHARGSRNYLIINLLFSSVFLIAAIFYSSWIWEVMAVISSFIVFLPCLAQRQSQENVKEGADYIKNVIKDTWKYFAVQFEKNEYLIADNCLMKNGKVFAKRTSPTNIGFSLTATLCAYINSLISKTTFDEYMMAILTKVRSLEKWNGHLYNWYDTESGAPLYPAYVSSVDSGNFCMCMCFVYRYVNAECRAVIDELIDAADFEKLFDYKRGLLKIGYNSNDNNYDTACYDLMASEALLTYIFCVAYGKISGKSFENLNRRFSKDKRCLYSWTGGAFEYLMPWLFVSFGQGSAMRITAESVVKLQKKNSENGIWGISESQYRALDDSGNYKYKAFGISSVSYSEQAGGSVIAPYASILGICFFPHCVIENMSALTEKNMYGEYGFYESYDGGAIRSFMAHHQGMILLSATNYLTDMLKNGFISQPRIKSALLQLDYLPESERYPLRKGEMRFRSAAKEQRVYCVRKTVPELNFISDGHYYLTTDSNGGGRAVWNGYLIYRDKAAGEGFNMEVIAEDVRIIWNKAEFNENSTIYSGSANGICAVCECRVINGFNAEMRCLTVQNISLKKQAVNISFGTDLILSVKSEYDAHPEFNKLFIAGEKENRSCICKNKKTGLYCLLSACGFSPEFSVEESLAEGSGEIILEAGERRILAITAMCGFVKDELVRKSRTVTEENFVGMVMAQANDFTVHLPAEYCSFAKKALYGSFGCNVRLGRLGYMYKRPVTIINIKGYSDLYGAENKIKDYSLLYRFGVEFDVILSVSEEYGYFNSLKNKAQTILDASGIFKNKPSCCRVDIVPESEGRKILKAVTVHSVDYYSNISEYAGFYRKRKALPAPAVEYPAAVFRTAAGYFTDNDEFVICDRQLRRPFSNIIANNRGGTLITEKGGGFTFGNNAREKKLSAFENESRLDLPSEALYFEENGNFWSATGLNKGDGYCKHGLGYTEFCTSYNGFLCKLTVGLSRCGGKLYSAELYNASELNRNVKICFAVLPVLGDFIDNNICGIEFRRFANNVYAAENVFGKMSAKIKFDGLNFDIKYGDSEKISVMLKKPLNLPYFITMSDIVPRGKISFSIEFGEELSGSSVADEIFAAKKFYGNLSCISFDFDSSLCRLVRFLPYQTYCSRFFGRTGYYQVGGAFGFRDQLQDCLAMLYIDRNAVRRHILNCAGRQFESGDVMHWWHEPYFGVRTEIMDDRLFLPYVVAEYIAFTGECEILAERMPFLKNVVLPAGKESVCDNMIPLPGKESLLEHCKRAVLSVCREIDGDGLVFMHGGDWNDGMNYVGKKGRGKSVWLTMFLYEVINKFLRYFTLPEEKKYLFEKLIELKSGADSQFNGSYFSRAVTDDGVVLGALESPECKIDLLTQAYSVISGITSYEKGKSALSSAETLLADKDAKLIKLLDPPFSSAEGVGYIGNYPAGIRENGGQYTHAAIWFVIALYKLGEKEKAYDYLQLLNPAEHCLLPGDAEKYGAEPYVMSADVYSGKNAGKAGWSWYTGSASWMYVTVVRYMFGITVKNDVITFSPNLPEKITDAVVKIKIGNSVLTADIDNTAKAGEWRINYGGVEYNTDSIDMKDLKGNKTITLKRRSSS